MFRRSQNHAVLPGLILLAVALCLPDVARADDKAELRAAFNEGMALQQKGDYPSAAKAYERALELAQQVLGPEHGNTVSILNNLANVYLEMDQFAIAEPLYQRSLKIRESKLGPDHPDVAKSLNNLAILYKAMGQYATAEPLYQRSLKILESKLGPDHSLVAVNLDNLAALYVNMGQYVQAEPLYQRCLKICESKLGADHLYVSDCLNDLANLYSNMGQYAKVELLCQRSLKIRESKLGPDHPIVAGSLNNLANRYNDMGQYAKAEPLYQRSIKIYESNRGADHPDVAQGLNNLANLYVKMGQYAKAEPLYQRSLKIYESKLGPDHPDIATNLNNLAVLYRNMGQYVQAEPLYQRCLKIYESKLGPDHPLVAGGLNNLAALYVHMGQYAQAEPLYHRCRNICESKLGADHPDVAMSLNNLAILYEHVGQDAKSEPLYQRSLKIRESQLGPNHPDVATSLNNLAGLHAKAERWSEATVETERVRRIIRRHVAHTLSILSEREQLTFLQTQDEYRLHSALSLGLHQRAGAETTLRSAGWVLNGKAVAQEVLAQRAILAAEGSDPTLAELAKLLLSVRRQLATMSLAAPKTGQEAAHREQLDKLTQQEQELSRQLGQANGRDTTADSWVEPAAVQKALGREALLIEIVRFRVSTFKVKKDEPRSLPPHYVAWLIPAEGQDPISIVDLGEAKPIDEAVQSARKALEKASQTILDEGEAAAEKQIRATMRELSHMVFEPLEEHFGRARELILSPDAALWLVPWGALPLPGGRYAIEKYQIRYVVSGRDLVGQATTKTRVLEKSVVFANPDYDLGPGEVGAATRAVLRGVAPTEQVASTRGLGSFGSLPRVARLPGTAEEAEAIKPSIARYVGAEPVVYQDQSALEGVFKAVHHPRLLVLSTHGFFLSDQEVEHKGDQRTGEPAEEGFQGRAVLTTEGKLLENPLLRCGLMLAGCNQREEETPEGVDDGILTGMEIVGTDLRGTELVVLSACETGLGEIRNGEGVAGLRQAFQLAGAKAVVSTLWQVPDRETMELMNEFFGHLSMGKSKAEALRAAQLSQIQVRREECSAAHPYYWAAFTITGE